MNPLSGWMRLSLRVKGFFIGTALATLLVSAACLTYLSADRESHAERSVSHALRVSQEIQKLKAAETDSVAGIRAYWITKDEDFANTVRRDLASFDETMESLLELTARSPRQRERLSQVAGLQRSRVELIFDAITRSRSGVLSDSEFRHALRQGEEQRRAMESLLEAMQRDEKYSLDAEMAHMDRLEIVTKMGIWQVFALAAASSFIIWVLFAYGIQRRMRDLRQSLAAIGTEFISLKGGDELKAICNSLAETAQNLHLRNQVLEGAFHGVAVADSGGHMRLNSACAKLLSLSDQGPGANIFEIVPREDRAALDHALSRMRSEGRAEAQVRVLLPDGSLLDLALTLSAQSGGGFYVFLRDNSLQKNAETALVRAKDAALSSNVAKTRFLAKIGHEIRTPLNAIMGSADLLADTKLTREQAEYVSIFRRNARRLVGLINDFLDLSKIEAGAVRVDKVPFRIRQTIHDAIDTFRDTASRKGLTLDATIDRDVPEWQLGDGHRLQQVLTNLVSNAVKFTSSGFVALRVLVTEAPAGRRLRLQVSDTGTGIRALDREKIFSPFTQLKDPGAPIHGTGLGLTICRELVELMNGTIGVESREGVGSTFYFELPLEPVEPPVLMQSGSIPSDPAPDSPERPLTLSPARTIRILIAEDAPDNRLLMQAFLSDQPVALRFAENGKEVMAALSAGEIFDLIFMDLDMPLVDGCAAARWVHAWQAQKRLAPTPIVALSAHAMHEMVRESLDAGCAAHVAKPVDRQTLIETIAQYAHPGLARLSGELNRASVSSEVTALVPKYLASQSKHIEEAREQLLRHDFDSIERFAHNLKGTGRGYGFPEIEKLGRELEQAARDNQEQNIARGLDSLCRFVADAASDGPTTPRVA